jgi:hypothetical protein
MEQVQPEIQVFDEDGVRGHRVPERGTLGLSDADLLALDLPGMAIHANVTKHGSRGVYRA